MFAPSPPAAVTLSNKAPEHNELQYEIWADIMNINVAAALRARESPAELLELRVWYLLSLVTKSCSLDKGQRDL